MFDDMIEEMIYEAMDLHERGVRSDEIEGEYDEFVVECLRALEEVNG